MAGATDPAPPARSGDGAEGARPDLSVILPVYNQGAQAARNARHLARFLAGMPFRSEIVVVDDGSSDGGVDLLLAASVGAPEVPLRVVRHGANHGKGFAVRRGVDVATGAHVVFTDIDLAYAPEDIAAIFGELRRGTHEIVVACRRHPASRYEVSPTFFRYLYTRHQLSRLFNWLVRRWLGLEVQDAQAGLKGFTRRAAKEVFSRARIERFTFDVELLCLGRALGLRLKEMPVTYRYDSEPSTVEFFRDGLRCLVDLVKIRWWLMTGAYETPRPPAV